MPKNNLIHLELIRGLAALIVFGSHATALEYFKDTPLRNVLNFGTEAVAVFFALSGYVMAHSQTNRPKSRRQFLKNRFKRIYPTYFIALCLAYAVGTATRNIPSTWCDISLNFIFAGTPQQHFARLPATNLALWSLTYEVGFYLLFSLCITKGRVNLNRLLFWSGFAVIAIIALPHSTGHSELNFFLRVLSFSCSWLIGYFGYSTKWMSSTRMSLPLLALIPAASRLPYESIQSPLKFCVIAFLTIPFFSSALDKPDSPTIYHGLVLFTLIALIAFCSEAQTINAVLYSILPMIAFYLTWSRKSTSFFQTKLNQKVSLVLGRISYPLYVLHMPLIFLAIFFDNAIVYLCLPISLTFLVWLVEYRFQPFIMRMIQ